MRKFLLPVLFIAASLATSCSSDDSTKMNEQNMEMTPKLSQCTNLALAAPGTIPYSTNRLFYWENGSLIRVIGRTYTSRVEIIDTCNNDLVIAYKAIDIFNTENYTWENWPTAYDNNSCYKFRLMVQSGVFCSSTGAPVNL